MLKKGILLLVRIVLPSSQSAGRHLSCVISVTAKEKGGIYLFLSIFLLTEQQIFIAVPHEAAFGRSGWLCRLGIEFETAAVPRRRRARAALQQRAAEPRDPPRRR